MQPPGGEPDLACEPRTCRPVAKSKTTCHDDTQSSAEPYPPCVVPALSSEPCWPVACSRSHMPPSPRPPTAWTNPKRRTHPRHSGAVAPPSLARRPLVQAASPAQSSKCPARTHQARSNRQPSSRRASASMRRTARIRATPACLPARRHSPRAEGCGEQFATRLDCAQNVPSLTATSTSYMNRFVTLTVVEHETQAHQARMAAFPGRQADHLECLRSRGSSPAQGLPGAPDRYGG